MSDKLVQVEHLQQYFPAGGFGKNKKYVQAVDDVSFFINRGETLGLVGESGCGKTTTGRTLLRLYEPTGGRIIYDDKVIFDKEKKIAENMLPYRKKMQIVFQDPYASLDPRMTVGDIVGEPIDIHHLASSKQERYDMIIEMLRRVGLNSEHANRYPHEFSGGQRQRVAMGRAIVRDPAVFLFDEPLSNLDAKLRVQMRLELQQLHRRLKTTSLYVTHDQVEAMTLAQRVMVMNGGVAEQIGTPVEVYEKPASLFVASFIGSPAMNLLTGRVNNEGTHFELDGGIELPLNGGYRQYAGRKMTLGIRPEHIALSSQAEGGVPLVMDTLEILGADNLAHGRWGEQKLVVRLAHQERPTAGSTLWLHLAENQLHLFDGETGQRV